MQVHTVPTPLVSVRHSETLKHRAWLRLAILGGANRSEVEDDMQGLNDGGTRKMGLQQGHGG